MIFRLININAENDLAGNLKLPAKSSLCYFLFFIFINASIAQNNFNLILQPLDKDTFFINKNITYQNQFGDSLAVINELSNVVQQLHNKSFFGEK